MQHPDHGNQVDALITELQVRRVHQAPVQGRMVGEQAPRQVKLLAAGVDKRDVIREEGQDHTEPPEAAAYVDGVPEPATVQQPPDGNHQAPCS